MAWKLVEPFEKNGEMFGTVIQGNGGVICFESLEKDPNMFGQAISELSGPVVKRAAQAEASKRGVSDPRLDMPQPPYAIDANGDQVINPLAQKVAGYRIDIKVTGRLV